MVTGSEAVAAALEAYTTLEELGTEIEDEWQYVTDLAAAYRARLEDLGSLLGSDDLPADASAAVEEAISEISAITDPHRAIDWLSTFPNVVALALGHPLWDEEGA